MYDSTIAHDSIAQESTVPSVRGEAWTMAMMAVAIILAILL